jgi:tetrahydromethanopterin S-methyltransferase subunit G
MDSEQIKLEFTNMDQRLTEMEEKIDSIDKKLNQVVDAILGNPLTKEGGFINDINLLKAKIEHLEREQEKTKEFKNKIMWTVGILVSIGAILQYITNLYSNFKK